MACAGLFSLIPALFAEEKPASAAPPTTAATQEAGWTALFNGQDLTGWKVSEDHPITFTVEDGAIKTGGERSHLYYTGPDGKASFKNFEFKCKAKTTKGSNAGLYFHTAWQKDGWPSKGYECQVNATHSDAKKSGGLYGIKDVMNTAPHKDDEWFDYEIKVDGKHVVLKINGQVTADYTEEEKPERPGSMSGRLLSEGTFAIQAHDPKSVCYFKDIMVKKLP